MLFSQKISLEPAQLAELNQKYKKFSAFKEDFSVAKKPDGTLGFVNKDWTESCFDRGYTSISDFSNGLAVVAKKWSKYGYVDSNFNEIAIGEYKMCQNFKPEGYANVLSHENTWVQITKDWKPVPEGKSFGYFESIKETLTLWVEYYAPDTKVYDSTVIW